MKRCIYCNKEKEDSEFSQEHILPKSIGGALQPINPFSTDFVCGRCNSISGFFIDGPFAKSWFINNYRADHAAKYARITPSTILPLVYMGEMKGMEHDNKICECYLGPTGDLIYHFHETYPIEPDTPKMVGVPPHIRTKDIDNGFAFIFLTSNNPQWIRVIFYSFADAFKKCPLYFGNGPTPRVEGANFTDIPKELEELHQRLWEIQGRQHSMSFSVDAYTGNRFLAKMALGLGSIFLHDSFKQSSDADLLRQYMWTKDNDERNKIPIHGSGLMNGSDLKQIDEFLKWEGSHVIGLFENNDQLSLYTNFYGWKGSLIQISRHKEHWAGIIKGSKIYIVVPEMQKYVGPIRMIDLVAHKNSPNKNPLLSELEAEMAAIPPLPPFKIENGIK